MLDPTERRMTERALAYRPPADEREARMQRDYERAEIARAESDADKRPGIRPIAEWGRECARGFVSNARFAHSATDLVIPRTNHAKRQKKARA